MNAVESSDSLVSLRSSESFSSLTTNGQTKSDADVLTLTSFYLAMEVSYIYTYTHI